MGRMEDVELVEVGVAPEAGSLERDEPLLRLGPLLRRWWPVPVALVLAVVGVAVATDVRHDAALTRLRETAGVITTTVEPPLEVVEWGTPETVGVLFADVRTTDGLVVGPLSSTTAGEPVALVALDPQTGAEQWRVDLQGDPGDTTAGVDCTGDDDPARTVWCVVLDGDARQLVGVDLQTRSVRTTRTLLDGVGARVSGDLLYVARATADGIDVVASDLADGTVRWRTRVPDPLTDDSQSPWPWLDGTHLWVWGGAERWALDPADGTVRAHAQGLTSTRGGRLVEDSWSSVSRLLTVDGTGSLELPGTPFLFTPDDGSAPDVLVLAGADGTRSVVRGVDVGTGETLWQRPPSPQTRPVAVVLDGVVYGTDPGEVWAVDARTGEERWSAEAGGSGSTGLMTDGVHLLQVEPGVEGDELVAYDLHDGTRAWSEPLPEGAVWLAESGGTLVGYSEDGTVRVLR